MIRVALFVVFATTLAATGQVAVSRLWSARSPSGREQGCIPSESDRRRLVALLDGASGGSADPESRETRGTIDIPALGLGGEFRLCQRRNGLVRLHVTMDGGRELDVGTDGDVAWEVAPDGAARLLDDTEREQLARAGSMGPADYVSRYRGGVRATGACAVDGVACEEFELFGEGAVPERWAVSGADGTVRRIERVHACPNRADIGMYVVYSDFRLVDGQRVPYVMEQGVDGELQRFVTHSVRHGTLSDGGHEFDVPEPVRRLVRDREQSGKQ